MTDQTISDETALDMIGSRIARFRLNRNLTQRALAREAGISVPTVQRIESGRSSQTTNLIRILRALDLIGNLDALIPTPPISPIEQARLRGQERQRASGKRKPTPDEPWTWEENE